MDFKFSNNLRRLAFGGDERVIAYRDGEPLNRTRLRADVLALYHSLRRSSEERVGVWLASGYDFLTVLLALALAGKKIVMPQNLQPQSAAELQPHIDALISDSPLDNLTCPQWQIRALALAGKESTENPPEVCFSRNVQLVLFTSGSTGEPAPIIKNLNDLEAELAALHGVWGAELDQRPVVSTVSHQHIYGLLHVILWPLARGAAFVDSVCHFPEPLAALAQAHPGAVLVSSPTHLARLPCSEPFVQASDNISVTFSSGGLLTADAAQAMESRCPAPLYEILGSTETGGVAWRRQSQSNVWQSLPGVEVSTTDAGLLQVSSAHLSNLPWFTMGDKAEMQADGRFELRGRADLIAKVEGKRLSLTELEQRLVEHVWVKEARAAVKRGRRDEVVIVASITHDAFEVIKHSGKRILNQGLREHLARYYEGPLLPRRWRFVEQLPRNSQGKLPQGDIVKLFEVTA
ncbi:AMP-binding protein [Gilvimarinus xylanilyticus]|uniref:AMP-binding protein n=1 Tax=Gilvimarinus xylanilyticus TaxID=2944139 RepID=A0A9X2KUQ7_9GAMM|nr:AMP-binding protein [Gilvimarinus xylanilyticus]MCP8900133.1 AMP-binding protein [Gilvimarinus xylanilyticus]